jgi:D-amino-acid oxidase
VLSNIDEAKKLSHTGEDVSFIINCTGLGALTLGGVEDSDMTPARAQIVLVRNEASPMRTTSGTDDGSTEVCYLMMRAAGGGTILGGTYEKGNWDAEPDMGIAERIMKRCVQISPELTGGKGIEGLDIVRHGVGLRPLRTSGVRIEADQMMFHKDSITVVHNYGHAGWGYQGSYGCAEGVVELVNKIRAERGEELWNEPKLFTWDS